MNNIQQITFSLHLILTVLLFCCYIVIVVMEQDELEEKAQGHALKYSNLLTLTSLVLYVLYKAMTGKIEFSPHVVLVIVNVLNLTYFLFRFLYMKGIELSFRMKNKKAADIICYISTGISVITTITSALKIKIFEIPGSLLRADTAVLIVNFIIISIMIGVYPKQKNVSRKEYKERKEMAEKYSKIFTIVYGIFIIGMVGYIIYRACTR